MDAGRNQRGEEIVLERSALVYLFLTIITIGLGLFVNTCDHRSNVERIGCTRELARSRVAVFAVFCLLAGVSACRIAVGNDYWVYKANFDLIAQDRHVSSEIGFNTIVRFFRYLFPEGKPQYLSIFAFFSIITVFFFVKALYDQGIYFAFSLFLLLTGGYYFNSLNSVRYYFALALALYAMKYVIRREYGKFILLILPGALIHKSILLVIPVYLLAGFLAGQRLRKWQYALGGGLVLSLIFCRNLYREIIFFFYPFYRDSAFDTGEISYTNIAKCLCVLFLCFFCYRNSLQEDRKKRFYFFLNLFGLVTYCAGSFIPEVSRIGYYMIISQVFLIPELLGEMKDGAIKKLGYAGVILAFSGYFVLLLKGMYAVDVRLLPYLNWIFN